MRERIFNPLCSSSTIKRKTPLIRAGSGDAETGSVGRGSPAADTVPALPYCSGWPLPPSQPPVLGGCCGKGWL